MPLTTYRNTGRLRDFVVAMTLAVERSVGDEVRTLREGDRLLSNLIAVDDWLPDAFSVAGADRYRQYLLYCDPHERFSVLSLVWGPGQGTPIHDHTVWGLVGVMRGAETSQSFTVRPGGPPQAGRVETLNAGSIERISPSLGDVHRVTNASGSPSVSIHVYGSNIGRTVRHVFDPETGSAKDFVSGYSNDVLPNIWS